MSRRQPKYAKKADASQEAIVGALRAAGAKVYLIGKPVDALIWCRKRWYLMEFKRDGFRKPRKDQQDQAAFCALHGVPYITSAAQALEYLQLTDAAQRK